MPKKSKKSNSHTEGSGSSSQAIKVFVRVRPPISNEVTEDNAITTPSDTSIKLTSDKHNLSCSYNKVFSEVTTQEEVFDEVRPLLADVLAGYNGCIFAYGQTSAGKTHTMLGPNGGTNLNVPKERWGILPRSAEYLFTQLEELAAGGNFRYTAKASFLQIYKERLYDLLRGSGSFEDDSGEGEGDLRIREIPRLQDPVTGEKYKKDENRPSEVFITGLSEYRVQTAFDVLKILAMGTANRATRSTNFNDTSSRSHALLQINFEIENKKTDGQILLYRSKLSLVDLAGSEKMQSMNPDNTSAHHLKELTSINKSLSSLGNVIASLSKKKRLHVPYRDSKLTRVLQDSLGGNTRTVLITCIAPTVLHASESSSTLQFADRARNVMMKAKANMVIDDKVLLADAQTEIARLKLLLKQALQKLEGMDGKNNAAGEFLDDGETNDELDRVLKENKKLRRDNVALQKAISGLRLSGAGGSSHDVYIRGGRGGGQTKSGKKAEWKSSLVDDEQYRKPAPKRRNRRLNSDDGSHSERELRTSRSSPLPVPTHVPIYDLAAEEYGDDNNAHRSNDFSLPGINNTISKRAQQQQRQATKSQAGRNSQRQQQQQQQQQQRQSSNQSSDDNEHLTSAILAQVRNADNALQSSFSSSQGGNRAYNAVAIGSPPKKSMAAVRKGYNDVVHEDEGDDDYEDDYDDGFDNDENGDDNDDGDDAVDAKKLRKSIDKVKNNKQLLAVEQKLNKASKSVAKELEKDTSSLSNIQASRLELERQLKELQMAQAAEQIDSSSTNPLPKSPINKEKQQIKTAGSPKALKPIPAVVSPVVNPSNKTSTSVSKPTNIASSDAMMDLSSIINVATGTGNVESVQASTTKPITQPPKASNDKATVKPIEQKATVAVQAKPRTKSEVKNQHPPADLKYSQEDVGRKIELYSYKFATWDVIELVDFNETSGNMHKCRSESDKTEKWIDLKKKPIRGMVVQSEE